MVDWPTPGVCPDCGGRVFQFGPQAGATQNIGCVACGQWWTVVMWLGPIAMRRLKRYPRQDDRETLALAAARRQGIEEAARHQENLPGNPRLRAEEAELIRALGRGP